MHAHGTKFSRQMLWRGVDRHQSWGCAFDGESTMALQSMPLVCWLSGNILNPERNDAYSCNKVSQTEKKESSWQTLKFWVCNWRTADYGPPNYASSVWYGLKPAEYAEKIKRLNWLMHTHGTKFSRQRWWRVVDGHQSWVCAFYGQPTNYVSSVWYRLLIKR